MCTGLLQLIQTQQVGTQPIWITPRQRLSITPTHTTSTHPCKQLQGVIGAARAQNILVMFQITVISFNMWEDELLGKGLRSLSAFYSFPYWSSSSSLVTGLIQDCCLLHVKVSLSTILNPKIAPKVSLAHECSRLFITPDGLFCHQRNNLNVKAWMHTYRNIKHFKCSNMLYNYCPFTTANHHFGGRQQLK